MKQKGGRDMYDFDEKQGQEEIAVSKQEIERFERRMTVLLYESELGRLLRERVRVLKVLADVTVSATDADQREVLLAHLAWYLNETEKESRSCEQFSDYLLSGTAVENESPEEGLDSSAIQEEDETSSSDLPAVEESAVGN
jgi:hypothetical protein